ncbi:hypothetical protein N658DRAFT_15045 [Parathielavia hyrcaniae]|uniref:ADF-H domain-containing protein n=1 Tax=Parathielavia hyrcaniae TaxID=113614 RepID=A0AAN6QF56_9PEZI|nr:hypothetical protein N658DRAFT_15045 [Parathielavia hyrcaniae]
MSLNGLDDTQVKAAHEAAVAEPGGWFLLKYASRDEVELLGRGSGGIVEIRDSIAQYDEKSPLYGFLRYRRRSVLIKYLPEDCSRLIQDPFQLASLFTSKPFVTASRHTTLPLRYLSRRSSRTPSSQLLAHSTLLPARPLPRPARYVADAW